MPCESQSPVWHAIRVKIAIMANVFGLTPIVAAPFLPDETCGTQTQLVEDYIFDPLCGKFSTCRKLEAYHILRSKVRFAKLRPVGELYFTCGRYCQLDSHLRGTSLKLLDSQPSFLF